MSQLHCPKKSSCQRPRDFCAGCSSHVGQFCTTTRRRRGKVLGRLLAAIVVVGGLGLGWWRLIPQDSSEEEGTGPITTLVACGPFIYDVVERGSVESSSNVEIRCEVQARNSAGTTILEVVPEGAYVEQGDLLARLDDSSFQAELLQQEIICNNSESQVIEAEADVEAAELALEEYLMGTFTEDVAQLESAEFVAKENLRRAEEYLQYSQKLAERGYISEVQLEADKFAVEKARKELVVATTKLEVLHKFSKRKMTNQLEAAGKTAQARLKSRTARLSTSNI